MGGENKDTVKADKGTSNDGSHPGDAETNANSINTALLTPDVILALTRQQTAESEGPAKSDEDTNNVGNPPPRQEKYSSPRNEKYSDSKSDKGDKHISVGNPPRDEKSSTSDSEKKAGKSISVGSRPHDEKSSYSNSSSVNTQLSPDVILSLTRHQTEGGEVDLSTTEFGVDMPSETHAATTENSHSDSDVQDEEVARANPLPLRRGLPIIQESAPGAVRVNGIEGEQTTDAAVPPSTELAPVEPLVSATVVDDDVDNGTLRENIRQDVLREVAHTEGELVDAEKEEHRQRQIWIGMTCCFLAIALIVGLGVGLTLRNNSSSSTSSASSEESTESPTESPSMAPTTEQCHVCYEPNNNDAALVSAGVQSTTNWRSTIIEQTPLRTCQNVYDETLDLSIWDEGCAKLQADASWKCGCPRFPPVPEIVDHGNNTNSSSSSSVRCTLCPEGFEAVPISLLDPVSTCVRASTWLDIVGQNVTRDECDTLHRLAINGCRCAKVSDNNDAPVEMTTGQCISALDQIISYENGEVEDDTIERTYILCPNTSFKVGIANLANFETGNAIVDGQFPIVGRSNMKVLCGVDGSSANNCTIRDGSFGVFQSNGWGIPGSIMQDNIHVQGVTFVNVTNPIAIYSVANVTIEDCIFDRFGGSAVLALPWVLPQAPFRRQSRNLRRMTDVPRVLQPPVDPEADHGTIRILRSLFRNGRILRTEKKSTVWFREVGNFAPGHTAMSLHMDDCLFDARGNDEWYDDAIYARGEGYYHVTNTCFWGGRYNQPIYMGEEELSHVIGDEPDYFFDGNYYLRDLRNRSDTTEYCAMDRRGSEHICRAFFSGDIDVCTKRWKNELEDESTVHLNTVFEESTTCGTDELGQANYRGTINVTSSGKTCQAWDSQFPHSHRRTPAIYPNAGLESNFCRNPDNDERAWCYTTDPDVRFELCDVPSC